ncbi:Crossover junction endonuclease [Podosphaera aphanis]|nr:Crossover junction endonuclease [Podosphaera aphanis]
MPDANCANPLLLQWVGEWLEEAKTRNSKGVTTYKRAYDSLKANPIPFSHPSEAKQLNGFGDKLCTRLIQKMEQFCEENNLPKPNKKNARSFSRGESGQTSGDLDGEPSELIESPPKRQRKMKTYVPKFRSGGYGLILALATLREDPPAYMMKCDAIALAQPLCDSSYTAPSDPTKLYTAWKSINTLIDKQLVHEKKGGTKKYALTAQGWECARSIQKSVDTTQSSGLNFVSAQNDGTDDNFTSAPTISQINNKNMPSEAQVSDIVPAGTEIKSLSDLPKFMPIVLPPGSFTVEMVLDTREIRTTKDRDYIEIELVKKGVKPLKRVMELGDATWVAKVSKRNLVPGLTSEEDEIILDYIVERKRLDDLISSIKDKRFHEQKFRLGRSGIQHVIYIIEEISMQAEAYQKMDTAVQSAIAGTQVVNGYFVKKTQKLDETIQYLAKMTQTLREKYEREPLHVIPTRVLTTTTYLPLLAQQREKQPNIKYHISYPAFSCLMSKSDTLTLRDLYLKMLMCIKGVTGEKALEIQKRWKTPYDLATAYRKIDEGETSPEEAAKKKSNLISSQMGNLIGRKKIAQALSATISDVWGES